MGIGDDAASQVLGTAGSIANASVRLLFEVLRMQMEVSKRNVSENVLNTVKYGQINTQQFETLSKSNVKMAYTNFPAEHIDRMSELAEKYKSHFAVIEIQPGNIARIAFPENESAAISEMLKQVAQEQVERDATSLKYKNDIFTPEMASTANTVLECHDIPTFMFETNGGKTMAVVPSEYEQQFDAAVNEVKALTKQMKDIEVIKFTHNQDLKNLDYKIDELSVTEAQELNNALKSMEDAPEVQFIKSGNKIDVMYDAADAAVVNRLKDNYISNRATADEFLVDVVGNEMSVNKSALLINENEEAFFTKIPNTNGEQYIYLPKDEFLDANGTITGKIDLNKTYSIYNKDGKQISEMPGSELSEKYNSKSKYMNKDTKVIYSDTNSLEHIEMFNSQKNELMKINLDSAENIKKVLIAQGMSDQAADIVCSQINDKFSDEQKEVFQFQYDDIEIVYADIPNIDELKGQQQLSQLLASTNAVDVTGAAAAIKGEKLCVFDKAANKYALMPISSKLDIMAALNTKLGYDYIKSEVAANKIAATLDKKDFEIINSHIKELEPRHFDTNNIVLHNISYIQPDENNIFLTADKGGSINFVSFEKTASREQIEKMITDKLEIKDTAAVAELVSKLDNMDMLPPSTEFKTFDKDTTVNLVTSNYCAVKRNDISIILPKDNITAEKISTAFNMNTADADKLAASIKATIEKNAPGLSGTQRLSNIMKNAAEKFKNKTTDKIKAPEISAEKTLDGKLVR